MGSVRGGRGVVGCEHPEAAEHLPHVCVGGCVCLSWPPCRRQFSPSTLWVMGLELKLSGLAPSALAC